MNYTSEEEKGQGPYYCPLLKKCSIIHDSGAVAMHLESFFVWALAIVPYLK
jgi:hypothetical protein